MKKLIDVYVPPPSTSSENSDAVLKVQEPAHSRTPSRASVRRNISWLAAGNIIVKPLWLLFITAICMRVLGPTDYGILTTALALALMLAFFSNLGTSKLVMREVAKAPQLAPSLLSNLLVGRFLLICLATLITLGIGLLLNYSSIQLQTLLFASLFAAGTQLVDLCRAFYRAFEVLRFEAISIVTERGLVVLTGTTFLLVLRSPQGVALGMAIGMLLAFAANIWWVHLRFATLEIAKLKLDVLRTAYMTALPLGLFGFFADLYVRSGPVLLEALVGEAEAGIYGAAARLLEAMYLLPAIVVSAFLPRLSVLLHEGRTASRRLLFSRGLVGVAAASVALAIVITLLGPWLMHLLDPSPAFSRSGRILQVLAWAFPLMAVNFILSAALFAANEQKFLAMLCGIAVILSFAISLVLIPPFHAYGAVAALFVTELFVFTGCTWRYRVLNRH